MDNNNRKLNIAMVCDSLHYTAGSFVSTQRFAELLRQRGHNIIFITDRSRHSQSPDSHNGIKAYRFFALCLPKSEGSMYVSFPTPSALRDIFIKEKIDVVHVLLPTPATVAALRAARTLGIKVVGHSHAQPENLFMHLPKWIPFLERGLNAAFYKYLNWIYNNSDILLFPTEFARSRVSSKKRSKVVSNGVDRVRFSKRDASAFMKKYKIPKDTLKILYVGRLHPEKSVDTLLHAAQEVTGSFANCTFVIVGGGHQRDELEALERKLGRSNVIFTGKISDEELAQSYNAADIFVLPSLAELEGMVVLEAMACGKPILVADAKESASRFFVDGNGFLFRPKDSKDLASKTLTLLQNDPLRNEMAAKSLELSKKYDINESASEIESAYYEILQSNE